MENKKLYNLHPDWISGFTQADGCFNISFKNTKGFLPRARFIISQHIKDEKLILSIKYYFNCGIIIKSRKQIQFIVNSIDDLFNIILPHFNKYPLKSGKYISYKLFEEIIILMKNKEHLNNIGLKKIIKLAYNMNPLGIRKISIEELLSKLNLTKADLYIDNINNYYLYHIDNLSPWFIGGLIQGDGYFNISFKNTGICYIRLIIVQDIYSKDLLYELLKYFSSGTIIDCKVNMYKYTNMNSNNIDNYIIPILSLDNILFLDKKKQFNIFKEINNLIINKKHLSKEEKLKIIKLAYNMNFLGKKRKLSKEEFINKIFPKF